VIFCILGYIAFWAVLTKELSFPRFKGQTWASIVTMTMILPANSKAGTARRLFPAVNMTQATNQFLHSDERENGVHCSGLPRYGKRSTNYGEHDLKDPSRSLPLNPRHHHFRPIQNHYSLPIPSSPTPNHFLHRT
jgi:hypothetical protein